MAWGEVDGRAVLAVTGSDGTVRLHDPERRRPVRSLPGGGASTTAIAWGSLRGRPVVLTAHGDGPLLLRDAHQGVLLKTFASGDWVRAAAMGKIEGVPVVAAACNDGNVRLWNALDGSSLPSMNGHQEAVSSVFWADIGKPDLVMVTAAGNDDAIRVWYPSLRRPGVLRTLLGLRSGRGVVTRGRMDGRDVTVVPDRDVFLLYDPADGPPAHQVPFPAGLAGQWIFVMAWGTFDGRPILAVAGSFPVIWLIDPADGRSASVNWPGRVVSLDFRATSECGAPCVLAVGDSKGFAVVELRQPLFGTPG